MSKRILILAGSPRKNGNSAALCRAFARGAEESGHQVETIFLRDKKIGFCLACYHCKKSGGICIIKDDMADILDKMNAADVFVMAARLFLFRRRANEGAHRPHGGAMADHQKQGILLHHDRRRGKRYRHGLHA